MKQLISLKDLLADADIFTDGDWVESKDQDINGDIRLTQLADVGDGKWINKSARFLTSAKAKQLRCTFLKPGDLLLARMPDPLGRCCIFPGDPMQCVTVVDVCIMRPDPQKINNRYLMHAINAPLGRREIARHITGTTRQRISRKNLGKLQLPLPPFDEQKRIAAILDAADALRAKRRESLAQLDELIQSTFIDMFGDPVTNPKGWKEKPLGIICDVRDGTHDSPKYQRTGHPLLTSKNFKCGVIDYQGANLISDSDYHQINKRSKVDVGDLVIPMIGSIGNPVLIKNEPNFAIKNVALIKFSETSIDNKFVHALLSSHYFDHITSKANRGGTQKFVALKDLRNMPIPLPPLPLQHRFAAIVESIEKQKALQRTHLAELNTLFASLQQRAFNGELSA